MKSLISSIIFGESSSNNCLHQHNHHHHPYFHHHNNHSKQNSFSSEIMSTITESSNSSIDSGTFDSYDDPDDHFYDEPLLSSFDYHYLDKEKHRNSSSSDTNSSHSSSSSSVIESLLLRSCSNNYKPLDNICENPKQLTLTSELRSSASSHNLISTNPITIKKPKIRPPKPPRHINPLTGKKLINQSVSADLLLTLPPKGVCSLSSSASSSGVSSSGSPSPSPSFKLNDNSPSSSSSSSSSSLPPPLTVPSISKKPTRPPPPIPDHPPKPLRKKIEIQTSKDIEKVTSMAVLNRSRSSQGSFYETAFDSKAIDHNNSLRGKTNQLSQYDRESIKVTYHSNHRFHRNNEFTSSDASFITDNLNSSRSSTASPSSSSSTGHESSSPTPKHIDQLAASLLPRRQSNKSSAHIPRSKSSDVTLNLSSSINKFDMISMPSESTTTTTTKVTPQVNSQSVKHNQQNKIATLSTFSMVKSTTSDTLSTFDFEAGRVLTRTRSNLDSLRLSIQNRNNNRIANLPLLTTSINGYNNNCDVIGSSLKDNNHQKEQKSATNKIIEKLPPNRSFRRLNLKLEKTHSSNNLSSPKLQSPLMDTRPLDDYDTPWDSNQRFNKVINKLTNTPTNEKDKLNCFLNDKTSLTQSNPNNNSISNTKDANRDNVIKEEQKILLNNTNDAVSSSRVDEIGEQLTNQLQLNQEECDKRTIHANNSNFSVHNDSEPNKCISSCSSSNELIAMDQTCKPERPRKLSLPLNFKDNNCKNSSVDSSPSTSCKLTRALRKTPLLTFNHQPLPVVSEDIDTSLILEKQGWYHGSITRLDAENLLRHLKEGSYLIRNCESSKHDYSLSLKSVKGFMHMKIVKQSDGFVLGVFSKPFENIPEMVKHYSVNKLPIRGAEHMSLLYPVIDQLL